MTPKKWATSNFTKLNEQVLFFILVNANNSTVNLTMTDYFQAVGDYKPHPAIIEGYEASINEFPYAVRLYILETNKIKMCTGQTVHKRFILTAAHCVEKLCQILIVTGEANQKDYVQGKEMYKYARYKMYKKFVHPEFDHSKMIHDVALIKTYREMVHKGYGIIPISYEPLKGVAISKIYGWGQTEYNKENHQLYAKEINVTQCNLTDHFITRRYICLLGKGIEHGDSGGGLIINGSTYGLAAFYKAGIATNYYYTALSEEKDFVKKCIAENGSNYNHCIFNLNWLILFYQFLIT